MPLMIDLKRVVVFGGERGEGLQKTQKLSFFADELLVVPETPPREQYLIIPPGQPSELNEKLIRRDERSVPIYVKTAADSDLQKLIQGASFVVSDLDDAQLNERIFATAQSFGVLCNVIDTKPLCNTWFMSLIETENLLVALSTKGQAAFFAAQLRKTLQPVIEKHEKHAKFWVELRARLRPETARDTLRLLRASKWLRSILVLFGPRQAQRWALKFLQKRGWA